MISVSDAFKAGGRIQYLIEISDDGISWQEPPDGAKVISAGSISNEIEAGVPFSFVGPDCEIYAENINNWWSSPAGTGKLDSGAMIQLRIQTTVGSATDEYITHIRGPIDLASVQKTDGDFVTFTVRGSLNYLDNILADYVLADRPGTYPYAFNHAIKISAVDQGHPEGLYLLEYKDGKLTWDSGPAIALKDQATSQTVTGQTGNTLTIEYYNASDDFISMLPPECSQYLALKKDSSNVLQVYQVNPHNTLQHVKELISPYVDLDITEIDNIQAINPDVNIATYSPDGNTHAKLNPICIVPTWNQKKFYASFGSGVMSGVWEVEIDATAGGDPLRFVRIQKMDATWTGSGVLVKGLYLYYENAAAYTNKLYLLYDTAATPEYNNDQWLSSWEIREVNLQTGAVVTLPGAQHIAWRSFSGCLKDQAGNIINELYALRVSARRAGNSAYIVKMTWSGTTITYANKSAALTTIDKSVSLFPSCMVNNQFYCLADSYRNFSTGYIDQKIYVYDIIAGTNATAYTLSDVKYKIDFDFKTAGGAVNLIPTGPTSAEENATEISNLSVMLTIGGCTAIFPDFITAPSYPNVRAINGAERKLYNVIWTGGAGENMRVYRGIVKSSIGNYSNTGSKTVLYLERILDDNLVGKSIKFTSGANAGDIKSITAQEDMLSGLAANGRMTKITFNAFDDFIIPGDAFEIYNTALTGAVVSTAEISLDDIDIMIHNPGDSNGSGLIVSNKGLYKNVSTGKAERNYYQAYSQFNDVNHRRPISDNQGRKRIQSKVIYKRSVKLTNIAYVPIVENIFQSPVLALAYGGNDYPGQTTARNYALVATNDGLMAFALFTSMHKPEFIFSDYRDGSLRDVVQDIASMSNARLMPSEHSGSIKYLYRGVAYDPLFALYADDYIYDNNYSPFYNYKAVTINGKTYGRIENNKFDYTLSLDIPSIPECLSYGLAKDIYNNLDGGAKMHRIRTIYKVWLEPGDVGHIGFRDDTTKKVMVISVNTDFESKEHTLTLLEVE